MQCSRDLKPRTNPTRQPQRGTFLDNISYLEGVVGSDQGRLLTTGSTKDLRKCEAMVAHMLTALMHKPPLRGATPCQLRSLPTQTSAPITTQSCAICTSELLEGESRAEMACGHHFHRLCLQPWLLQRNSCPLCRRPISYDFEVLYGKQVAPAHL